MVKLFCRFVGEAGNAIPVDVRENETVGDLTGKFAANAQYAGRVDKMQLFLAKTADGAWLPSNDPDVVAMRSGAVSEKVQNLLNGQIDPAEEIADVFVPAPQKKQIHVLVVVPRPAGSGQHAVGVLESKTGHVRVDIGGTASRALKYKRPTVHGRQLLISRSIVLVFGENPTDEKGCLTVPGRSFIVCQMIGVDIAVGAILSYSQHWKSKLDNMTEEAKDETPLQAQRQEMTDLTFAAEAQHQELTEHASLLPATEAQRQPQQQPLQSTKRNRGRGKRK
ncbi:unnamed protein product [Phytophthora fragariaefolia]|uniref:Unnamed protein product n=1 Tax=Phytophthora fragariaefolia TaxID=1490495 RepID=A0A9W7CUY9_9STRA|nr:unnamed protein product [Phytophthora fragariaefolia]